jgi:hypothetical protein
MTAPAPWHHPVTDQAAPSRWRPQWTVPHLVYQGGDPRLPKYSLTGGGFIPTKSFAGKEGLMWQPYVTPISSQTGGGFIAARPNFLTALLKGVFQSGTT